MFISNKVNTDRNALSQFCLLQKWRQKLHKNELWTTYERPQNYIQFLTSCLERCWRTLHLHYAHIIQEQSREMAVSIACIKETNEAKQQWNVNEMKWNRMSSLHKLNHFTFFFFKITFPIVFKNKLTETVVLATFFT